LTAGDEYDQLVVSKTASLDGTMEVRLIDGFLPAEGDSFDVLVAAGGVSGEFASLATPPLDGGLDWAVLYGPNTVTLEVFLAAIEQLGDTNGDGLVNIDDLNNVRNNFGATGAADGSLAGDAFPFDGLVNIDDLNAVRNDFGAGTAVVPEPSGLLLLMTALLIIAVRRRRGENRTFFEWPSNFEH